MLHPWANLADFADNKLKYGTSTSTAMLTHLAESMHTYDMTSFKKADSSVINMVK